MKPVLVVGAGLSAADAVSICRSSGINVIHVYRNRSAGLDKMLPETVYPEYHEVSLRPLPLTIVIQLNTKNVYAKSCLLPLKLSPGAQNDERQC